MKEKKGEGIREEKGERWEFGYFYIQILMGKREFDYRHWYIVTCILIEYLDEGKRK